MKEGGPNIYPKGLWLKPLTGPPEISWSLHLALNNNTLGTVGSSFGAEGGGSGPEYWLINPTDNPGRIKSTDRCNQLTASLWDIRV